MGEVFSYLSIKNIGKGIIDPGELIEYTNRLFFVILYLFFYLYK